MNSNTTKLKVLFITTPTRDKCFIREALQNTGYEFFEAKSSKSGIQKTIEYKPDLIICQNELDEYSGFQMYNLLKETIIKEGILFFIYSDYLDKEDILIGLEMGVDNFVISPVNEKALIEKIERQVLKVKDSRRTELESLKTYLQNTPIAKFVVINNVIDLANDAFLRMLKLPDIQNNKLFFTELFQIDETNISEYKKCMHGFIKHCRLNNVPTVLNHYSYDIFLHYIDHNGKGCLFGEITRSLSEDIKTGKEKKHLINLQLTKREQQVLEYSSLGLPIKQIAGQLELSQRTVEKHRANIMKKTGTSNIVEAIYAASAFIN